MVPNGYSLKNATGVVINAGTPRILLPPSIVKVVYAAATEQSVGRLFVAASFRASSSHHADGAIYVSRTASTSRASMGRLAQARSQRRLNAIWACCFVVSSWAASMSGIHADRGRRGFRGPMPSSLRCSSTGLKLKDLFGVRSTAARHRDADVHHQQRRPLATSDFPADPADLTRRWQRPRAAVDVPADDHIAMLVAGNFMEPTSIVLNFARSCFRSPGNWDQPDPPGV